MGAELDETDQPKRSYVHDDASGLVYLQFGDHANVSSPTGRGRPSPEAIASGLFYHPLSQVDSAEPTY